MAVSSAVVLGDGVESAVGADPGVAMGACVVLGVGVAVVSSADDSAVAAGAGIWFRMRSCSAKYHLFTCGSIVAVSSPIRNARSVFLFFAATFVPRSSSLASCFFINADHLASDCSSLMAAWLLASAMHFSIADFSI